MTNRKDCEHMNLKCCRYTGFTFCDDCGYWHSWIVYGKSPKEMYMKVIGK